MTLQMDNSSEQWGATMGPVMAVGEVYAQLALLTWYTDARSSPPPTVGPS